MSLNFSYALGRGLFGVFQSVPALLGLACYVLSSLAFYTMAQKRDIKHPWLAWVPVANVWILGSLSDQYRYVVKGEVKSRRKLLLTLNIISAVLGTVFFCMTLWSVTGSVMQVFHGFSEEMIAEKLLGSLLRMVGISLLVLPLTIVKKVFRYMALYDVFRSCDPENGTMFLVMSIFFAFLEPFFLFFSREKELGMPPRKYAAPAPEAPCSSGEEPREEHCEESCQEETKEYL